MRVLYLSNAAEIGGANRGLLTLWRGLAVHGVKPAAVCPGDGPMVAACAEAGVPCDVIEYQQPSWREPLASWQAAQRWGALLSRVGPDLVHANDFHNARSVSLAARRHGVPVICHIRFHQHARYLRWVFRGLPKPAAFIHNSGATRNLVEPALRLACPRAEQVVIHNGVSLERFQPASPPRRDVQPVCVGIVGNLIPIKGHMEFLDMARRLSDQQLDARYLIIGEDIHGKGYRAVLEARTRELGLGGRIAFLGHRSDIPDLMRELDVLVCASHVEPFGINIIEGMASELPVVGTRVGGIPEVIEDGVTGCLVPPSDATRLAEAVGSLLRDPARRRAMGQAGRARAERLFSEQKHVAEVVSLYRRVQRRHTGGTTART